jgi:hypothetical protein
MSDKITVGQRVSATRFDRRELGTVTRVSQGVTTRETGGGIAWVRWDESHRETWMHITSLTPA